MTRAKVLVGTASCLVPLLYFVTVEFRPWVNYWLALVSPVLFLIFAPTIMGYLYLGRFVSGGQARISNVVVIFVGLMVIAWFAHRHQLLVRVLFPYYVKGFDSMDRTLDYWPSGSNIGPFPIYLTRHDDRGGFWASTGSTMDFPGVDNRNYGFVYRPTPPKDDRDDATPFGSNWIYLRHIHGDWYSFAVVD